MYILVFKCLVFVFNIFLIHKLLYSLIVFPTTPLPFSRVMINLKYLNRDTLLNVSIPN